MNKFLVFMLIAFSALSQDKVIPIDSTSNIYVLFVRPDSVGVAYKAKQGSFVSDGIFAKDYAGFNLKLSGFVKFDKVFPNLSDVQTSKPITTSPIITNPVITNPVITTPIGTNPNTNQVTNAFPTSGRYSGSRYLVEAADWGRVSDKPLSIVGMNGYDFSPIEMDQISTWVYGDWKQTYLSVKGNRDIWIDGGKTYFLKPVGYSTNTDYNLMDFDLRFPNFTLPKNKTVVMQPTPKREIGVYNYLKKGVSAVKDRRDDKGYVFVSDGWLIDLGCPAPYTSTKEDMDRWCAEVDSDKLLNAFIQYVYYPCRWSNVVLLNWEHVGNRWNVRQDKILRCLEYWRTHEHTAKLGMYAVNGVSLGRPKFQGLNHDYTDLLTFEGTLEEFQRKFNEDVSVDMTYAKYVEIAMVGGYMNYPIEEGVLHHYLFELLMHRKFNQGKTILANTWFDMEFIQGFNIGRERVDSEDGSYYAQVKPKIFPSIAFNWGVWSVALGDGIDVWSDPNYWTEDKRYWGWAAKDLQMNDLPMKHDEVVARYPSQPMKSIDWIMSGVYSVSVNKDIVEHSSDWKFVTLPTKSFHNKSVLIAYKIKDGEVLVLALDAFGKPDGEVVHEFQINGKKYDVKTFGRFTSVVRFKL